MIRRVGYLAKKNGLFFSLAVYGNCKADKYTKQRYKQTNIY